MGLFLCPNGGDTNGLPQSFLCGADLVHRPVQAPAITEEGEEKCQVDPSVLVPTPDAPSSRTDSTVKITLLLPDANTTNTNAPQTLTRSMAVPGNGFETATSVFILFVSSAKRTAELFLRQRFITRCPSPKAALMPETISCPFADPATTRSTTRLVTGRGL